MKLWENAPEMEDIKKYAGFVYMITNLSTGQKYIGRKYFWSIKRVKGRKNRKRLESDWKTYFGSSDLLKEALDEYGFECFRREIVSLHKTRGQVNSAETELLWEHDVLNSKFENGDFVYYNRNIGGKKFALAPISDATVLKIKEACAGRGMYRYPNGKIARLKVSHPDVINGNVVCINKGVDRKWVTKDGDSRFILLEELQSFINKGWEQGRILSNSSEACKESYEQKKSKKWMTNGVESVHIYENEFEKYKNDGFKFGRTNNKSKKKVKQIDRKTGEIIKVYDSMAEAKAATGADVSAVIRGAQTTSKGFKWELL